MAPALCALAAYADSSDKNLLLLVRDGLPYRRAYDVVHQFVVEYQRARQAARSAGRRGGPPARSQNASRNDEFFASYAEVGDVLLVGVTRRGYASPFDARSSLQKAERALKASVGSDTGKPVSTRFTSKYDKVYNVVENAFLEQDPGDYNHINRANLNTFLKRWDTIATRAEMERQYMEYLFSTSFTVDDAELESKDSAHISCLHCGPLPSGPRDTDTNEGPAARPRLFERAPSFSEMGDDEMDDSFNATQSADTHSLPSIGSTSEDSAAADRTAPATPQAATSASSAAKQDGKGHDEFGDSFGFSSSAAFDAFASEPSTPAHATDPVIDPSATQTPHGFANFGDMGFPTPSGSSGVDTNASTGEAVAGFDAFGATAGGTAQWEPFGESAAFAPQPVDSATLSSVAASAAPANSIDGAGWESFGAGSGGGAGISGWEAFGPAGDGVSNATQLPSSTSAGTGVERSQAASFSAQAPVLPVESSSSSLQASALPDGGAPALQPVATGDSSTDAAAVEQKVAPVATSHASASRQIAVAQLEAVHASYRGAQALKGRVDVRIQRARGNGNASDVVKLRVSAVAGSVRSIKGNVTVLPDTHDRGAALVTLDGEEAMAGAAARPRCAPLRLQPSWRVQGHVAILSVPWRMHSELGGELRSLAFRVRVGGSVPIGTARLSVGGEIDPETREITWTVETGSELRGKLQAQVRFSANVDMAVLLKEPVRVAGTWSGVSVSPLKISPADPAAPDVLVVRKMKLGKFTVLPISWEEANSGKK